jgi:hypothetical protein
VNPVNTIPTFASVSLSKELFEYLVPSVSAYTGGLYRPTVRDLIAALDSDNSDQRQAARVGLSKQNQISALRTAVAAWDIQKSSYRQDLGLLVAWTEAIHEDHETGIRLLESLSAEQVTYMLALAGHPDLTMRVNATQLIGLLLEASGSPVGNCSPPRCGVRPERCGWGAHIVGLGR